MDVCWLNHFEIRAVLAQYWSIIFVLNFHLLQGWRINLVLSRNYNEEPHQIISWCANKFDSFHTNRLMLTLIVRVTLLINQWIRSLRILLIYQPAIDIFCYVGAWSRNCIEWAEVRSETTRGKRTSKNPIIRENFESICRMAATISRAKRLGNYSRKWVVI